MSVESKPRSRLRVAIALGVTALVVPAFNACQFFGGRPGGDGAVWLPDASWNACPDASTGTCHPDPGWAPPDCTADDNIEKLTIVDFDDTGNDGYFQAHDLYTYQDNSAYTMTNLGVLGYERAPGEFLSTQSTTVQPPKTTCTQAQLDQIMSMHPPVSGYQPPATQRNDLCGGGPSGNGVFHIVGGPFRAWGGGFGVSMQKMNGRNPEATPTDQYVDRYLFPPIDKAKSLCIPDTTRPGGMRPDLCPPDTDEYALRVATIDVSSYDGVSFWARRGPTSQAGIRVMVGDRYTDDDLNFITQEHNKRTGSHDPLYCQRIKACGCLYGYECKYSDDLGAKWCQDPCDPKVVAQCTSSNSSQSSNSQNGGSTNCQCGGVDNCNKPYPAFAQSSGQDPLNKVSGTPEDLPDPQFYGKPCTPYDFADGDGNGYCFDPATDSPPAPGSERCGDFWMKTATLTTDWQFFKVPFTDLRQQGWAKKAPLLDLHHVSVARFSWDTGTVDFWIDDFSFYKNKP